MMPRLLLAEIWVGWILAGAVATAVFLLLLIILLKYGALWFQAYMSGADVSFWSLIGMSFRQIKPGTIVIAKIMGRQAGLNVSRRKGMSTARLEAHYLAGGDVPRVMVALIAAQRANIALNFDQATAIDLAGRDVLDAVRTSVQPKVIDCPDPGRNERTTLTAIAGNGVELKVRARVTVRMDLQRLISGATADTIIARVGQGMITAIGSASSHMEVLEMPSGISRFVLQAGLDANTAYEIVSVDIADIQVGQNIGARLQIEQADADMRVAQANAEARRAEAVAREQEAKVQLAHSRSLVLQAESELPAAIGVALRAGHTATRVLATGYERPFGRLGR